MKRNILIISHTFPPASGIGGRRWVKFAKYLSGSGHNVQVITSENIQPGSTSEWLKDAEGLKVEFLPYKYPHSLVAPVKKFLDKINYRLALLKVRVLDKGNYYDKGIFWKQQIQERVSHYIRERGVNTVIVTGAPFRLVYYVTELKPLFPDVTFISDFRDLWTEDLEISAFSQLSPARRHVEKQYEKRAVNHSDVVFTVSESMKNYFASLTAKNNCFVIPNGYDPDDLTCVEQAPLIAAGEKNKVRFVFAGTLYNNLDYILAPFFKAVKQIKEQMPELYKVFHFEFYGKFPEKYKKYISENELGDSVLVFGEKPYALVSAKMQAANFGVLFLNYLYNFSFSTKFCEYVAQKKKIVVISNKGATADFVIRNKLGYHVDSEKPFEGLVHCIEKTISEGYRIDLNEHFDETVFSIARISKDVEKHLSTINITKQCLPLKKKRRTCCSHLTMSCSSEKKAARPTTAY